MLSNNFKWSSMEYLSLSGTVKKAFKEGDIWTKTWKKNRNFPGQENIIRRLDVQKFMACLRDFKNFSEFEGYVGEGGWRGGKTRESTIVYGVALPFYTCKEVTKREILKFISWKNDPANRL
jgi:hypothetical protein